MGRHTLSMVLDPCLKFRVERARDGRVSVVVDPVAEDGPPYRVEIREGEVWVYGLRLDMNGLRQHNRVERNDRELPAAVEHKGIGGHFRRRS